MFMVLCEGYGIRFSEKFETDTDAISFIGTNQNNPDIVKIQFWKVGEDDAIIFVRDIFTQNWRKEEY